MEVTGQPQALASLLPEKEPIVWTVKKAGWVLESIWIFKRRENFLPLQETNFNNPAHSVVTILTLKTADTLITFYLAATKKKQNKTNYIIPEKIKQLNEKQPTKITVVVNVKLSDLKEPSSWSKAAYWGLELFLSKGV